MPLKNYTTIVPADRSINEIQQALVKHGARGVAFEYEKDGRISALQFTLSMDDPQALHHVAQFALPVNWRLFQAVLQKQKVRGWKDEQYVYRVAWRNLRDWVLAQLALHETAMVELPQVFLPFVQNASGHTLYEAVKANPRLLLTEGR